MEAKINVTNRQLAYEYAKRLPLDGEEFRQRVNELEKRITRMPNEARIALKASYIFSHKLPKAEREDAYQEFTLKLLEARINNEPLAYAIARCDWKDYYRKLKTKNQFQFISILEAEPEPDTHTDGYVLSELLVGEAEFENVMDGKIDGERIWQKLPENIKTIVAKRLRGFGLPDKDRQTLSRWIKQNPMLLATNS